MRMFLLVPGLLVLSAAAAAAVGCGGGVCSDYCQVSLECAAVGCELADTGQAINTCANACQDGLDAVSDAKERQAVQDCLACITPLYKDTCELSNDAFLKCQSQCTPAVNAIQVWVEAFGKSLENETILCTDGTPVGGGDCTLSSSGDGTTTTCSVECTSGSQAAGAQCEGAAGKFTCQCTQGANQGQSFSSDCDALDETVAWDVCN